MTSYRYGTAPKSKIPYDSNIFVDERFTKLKNPGQRMFTLRIWNADREFNHKLPPVLPPGVPQEIRPGDYTSTQNPRKSATYRKTAITYNNFMYKKGALPNMFREQEDRLSAQQNEIEAQLFDSHNMEDLFDDDPDIRDAIVNFVTGHSSDNPGRTHKDTFTATERPPTEAGPSGTKKQKLNQGQKRKEVPFTTPKSVKYLNTSETPDIEEIPENTTEADMVNTRSQGQGDTGSDGTSPAPTPMEASGKNIGGGTSSGGFDSMQGPSMYIERPFYRHSGGYMAFSKVHHLKAWAYPFLGQTFSNAASSTTYQLITTPLMRINWDRPYFYMSPEEFNNLIPDGSRFTHAEMHIKVIGSTVTFETGVTSTQAAITGHPKIAFMGKNLESKLRPFRNFRGVTSATSNTDIKFTVDNVDTTTSEQDFIKQQYGSKQDESTFIVPGVACGIPYWNTNQYGCYIYDKYVTADGSILGSRAPGMESIMSEVEQFNVNDTTWSDLPSVSYKFTSAPVKSRYQILEIGEKQNNSFTHTIGNRYQETSTRFVDFNSVSDGGAVSCSYNLISPTEGNLSYVNYDKVIEQSAVNNHGSAPLKPSRQPDVYIGQKAIGRPGGSANIGNTRASSFVPSYLNIVVTATIYVKCGDYPNRYTRPPGYNVNVENGDMGIGKAPATHSEDLVTFSLLPENDSANSNEAAVFPTTARSKPVPRPPGPPAKRRLFD